MSHKKNKLIGFIILSTTALISLITSSNFAKAQTNEGTAFQNKYLRAAEKPLANISQENFIIFGQNIEEFHPYITPTQVSTPTPTTAPTPDLSTTEGVKQRICEVFGPNCDQALTIAYYESHYNPNAISPGGDYGVFQMNCYWQGYRVGGNCNAFLDAELNIQIAKQIFDAQGWYPWSTKIHL